MTPRFLRSTDRPIKVATISSAPPEIQGLANRFRANAFKRPDCDRDKGTGVAFDLERVCPEALDLDALSKAYLHVAVNGDSPELAGNRGETYFRDQLRNVRATTTDDVCRLAVQAPAVLIAWVRPILQSIARSAPNAMAALLAELAPLVGLNVVPAERQQVSAMEAAASVMAEMGPTCAAVVRDAADGTIDQPEAHLENIRRAKDQLAALEAAVTPGGAR